MSHAGNGGPKPHREPPPGHVPFLVLPNAMVHFVAGDEGTIELVLTPMVPIGPGQVSVLPPQVRVPFSKEGWETFKGDVARDGVPSGIIKAGSIPGLPG